MNSKFGGIPVKKSKFGGVPVDGGLAERQLTEAQRIAQVTGQDPALFAGDAQPTSDELGIDSGSFGGFVSDVGKNVAGLPETALSIGSQAVAPIAAGYGGMVTGLGRTLDGEAYKAGSDVEAIQSALTFQPKTDFGKEMLENTVGMIGSAADAVGLVDAIKWLEESGKEAGEVGEELGLPPSVNALLETAPQMLPEMLALVTQTRQVKPLLEAAGKADISSIVKKKPSTDKLLTESSPDVNTLKSRSRDIYDEIDESGVYISNKAFDRLEADVQATARKMGADKNVTPTVSGVLDRFKEELGSYKKISDIDTVRKVAQNAAKSPNSAEAAIGSAIISDIDDFLGGLTNKDIVGDFDSAIIGDKLKSARGLWSRAKKSELLQESFNKADLQASGFENGLRVQFRQILSNPKKRRGFSKQELAEMEKVVKGTPIGNMAKFLGKFGISEGQATSMLGASIGTGGGAALGSAIGGVSGAGVGAVLVPAIGQVSKALAQKLTKNQGFLTDALVRAGADGRKIADAYIKNTPKKLRSPDELRELLIVREVPEEVVKEMAKSPDLLISSAALAAIVADKDIEGVE